MTLDCICTLYMFRTEHTSFRELDVSKYDLGCMKIQAYIYRNTKVYVVLTEWSQETIQLPLLD